MSVDLDALIARSTFAAIMQATKTSERHIARARKMMPTFVVLTEAGQTVVNDEQLARSLGESMTRVTGLPAFVVQVVQMSRPAPQEPKQLPPPESGEPPDGRCG